MLVFKCFRHSPNNRYSKENDAIKTKTFNRFAFSFFVEISDAGQYECNILLEAGTTHQQQVVILRELYGNWLLYSVLFITSIVIIHKIKLPLKLYCGYKYTRPCMINRIWSLK